LVSEITDKERRFETRAYNSTNKPNRIPCSSTFPTKIEYARVFHTPRFGKYGIKILAELDGKSRAMNTQQERPGASK